MIPFFRRIRKQLADDNRPLKYLRYAIGEIVLVVLGILIALQINNWNEERKVQKVELGTINAIASEFMENRDLIEDFLNDIKEGRVYGDSIRMNIGPNVSDLKKEEVNRWFGGIGQTKKCKVRTDILRDIQGSGKLNLISNEDIRICVSKWSSSLIELKAEENDWAQEFSNHFIPYMNKWIQWDDVDYLYNKGDPRYFESPFITDSRTLFKQPEFSNIMAIHYWRIGRIESRTTELLSHTNELLALIDKELEF